MRVGLRHFSFGKIGKGTRRHTYMVAISVLKIRNEWEMGVMEMGLQKEFGEMGREIEKLNTPTSAIHS